MGSSMAKNTSGDQSTNKKANDKTVAPKYSEQLSSSVSINANNKISDVADNLNEEIHSFDANIAHQPLKTKVKQKIYNELTESFETPDSSILDTSNESDNCEIGEDPLNCTTEVQIRSLDNNRQLSNIYTVRGGEDHSSLDNTLTLPLTDNSFSEDLEIDKNVDYERNLERESSVEVILKEVTEQNEFDIQKSIQASFDGVLNDVHVTDVLNPITGLYENYYNNLKTEFGENIEEDFDLDSEHISNERRDSGASILVIHSDGIVDTNEPEIILHEHEINETLNSEENGTSKMELSNVKNNNTESHTVEFKSEPSIEDVDKKILRNNELDIQNECHADMADGYKSSAVFNGDSSESKIESKDEIIMDLHSSNVVETKEFLAQEIVKCEVNGNIVNDALPSQNVDFYEPMDCDDSFAVTQTQLPNRTIMIHQENVNFEFNDIQNPFATKTKIQNSFDITIDEPMDVDMDETQLKDMNETFDVPSLQADNVNISVNLNDNVDTVDTRSYNQILNVVESLQLQNESTGECGRLNETVGINDSSLPESLDKTVSFEDIEEEKHVLNDTCLIESALSSDIENTIKTEFFTGETENPFDTKCCLQESVEYNTQKDTLNEYGNVENPFETKQSIHNSMDYNAVSLIEQNTEKASDDIIKEELQNPIDTNQSLRNSIDSTTLKQDDVFLKEKLQNPFETKQVLSNSIDSNSAHLIRQNVEIVSDVLENEDSQNPFESKHALYNSIDFNAAPVIQQNIEIVSNDLEKEDSQNPFESKQALRNSIDFNATSLIQQHLEIVSDDLEKEDSQNPFESKQALRNSIDFNATSLIQQNIEIISDDLEKEDSQNPFESKQALRNSIDFNATSLIQQNIKNVSDDLIDEELQNPFETKHALCNSMDFTAAPLVQQNIEIASDDIDKEELQNPFESKQALRNSIDFIATQNIEIVSEDLRKEELQNPIESKQALRNSIDFNAVPLIQENIENVSDDLINEELQSPFETKHALCNSMDFTAAPLVQQNIEIASDDIDNEELQNPFESKQALRNSIDFNATLMLQQNNENVSDDLISDEMQSPFESKHALCNSIEGDISSLSIHKDSSVETKCIDVIESSTQLANSIENDNIQSNVLNTHTEVPTKNEIGTLPKSLATIEVQNLSIVVDNETPVESNTCALEVDNVKEEKLDSYMMENSSLSTTNNGVIDTPVEIKCVSEEPLSEKLVPESDILIESVENPFEIKSSIRNSLDRDTKSETFNEDDVPNPFANKKELRNSLDRDISPTMNTKNGNGSFDDTENPFKIRRSIHRSPDRSANDVEDKSPEKIAEKISKTENKEVSTPYSKLSRSAILTTDSANDSFNFLNDDSNSPDFVDKTVIEKPSHSNTPDSDNSPASSNSDSTIRGKYYPNVPTTTPEKEIELIKNNREPLQNNPFSPMVRSESWTQDKKMAARLSNILNLSPMSKCGDLMGMSPTLPSRKNEALSANVEMDENDLLTGQSFPTDIADVGLNIDDDEGFTSPEELFKDPAAFDFLLNCGNSTTGANSGVPTRDFGKESLFVKFDPLVSRLPQGVRPGRETDLRSRIEESSIRKVNDDVSSSSGLAESCSSDSSITQSAEQGKASGTMSSVEQSLGLLSLQSQTTQPLIASVPAIPQSVTSLQMSEKPTQVVSPAKNARQYQPCTPPPPSKVSMPSSPAIAAIDRLINLGLNTPPPPPPVIQPKEPEMDPQLLKELQSVKELWGNQEQELQKSKEMVCSLQQQLSESTEREQALIERVNEKNKNHRQMSVVMEEYERTMSQLIGEREVEKRQWLEERATLIRERDEASSHLANIEHSFNDIHAKYERCKTVIHTYKTNEDILKQTLVRNEDNLKKQTERYEQLRQHAMSQLDKASQEIDAVRKSSQAEIIKYQAMLKKSEIQITSLQESLAQKTKNCEELTSICDELINKVG